jgi:uncharacterized membrane protein
MLIPFPIAFFVAGFVCDIAYWITGNAAWPTAAIWLIAAGLIMGALAALVGLVDIFGERRIRALNTAWWHAGGIVIIVLIEIYNWYARFTEGATAVLPKGLVLSFVVVCILVFTGWKGWEMVYHHRVGVTDEIATGQDSAAAAQRRAA